MNTVEGFRELLRLTKRNLQIVEAQLDVLQGERGAVLPALDVSSEHKTAWFSAVDDDDRLDGVNLGYRSNPDNFGLVPHLQHVGTIRVQEDAAFVCTDILLAVADGDDRVGPVTRVYEGPVPQTTNHLLCFLRLRDANSGRSLITGGTVGPLDRDRGAVPFSYFSSNRPGTGANVKNRLFSEFTIPRAGAVKVEVFNTGIFDVTQTNATARAFVTLVGYKVFGA